MQILLKIILKLFCNVDEYYEWKIALCLGIVASGSVDCAAAATATATTTSDVDFDVVVDVMSIQWLLLKR